MPELPEVEVLVRHLRPLLRDRVITGVSVRRPKTVLPGSPGQFSKALAGCSFKDLKRRGKYLLFEVGRPEESGPGLFAGHLGMTGRMYLLGREQEVSKHWSVRFELNTSDAAGEVFVFEDPRCFGRMTLDLGFLEGLGPEPLDPAWSFRHLHEALKRSLQPVKVRLMDQAVVAGIGNIYASEALFRAGISPTVRARKLSAGQVKALHRAVRVVLREAIRFGSTVPLDFSGRAGRDDLFYYGQSQNASRSYEERLRVYGRAGLACVVCETPIRRMVQAGRSTFYCPECQAR